MHLYLASAALLLAQPQTVSGIVPPRHLTERPHIPIPRISEQKEHYIIDPTSAASLLNPRSSSSDPHLCLRQRNLCV